MVRDDFHNREGGYQRFQPTMFDISTKDPTNLCDVVVSDMKERSYIYKKTNCSVEFHILLSLSIELLWYFYWRYRLFLSKMAEGIRRAMQDIDLGFSMPPVALPAEVVRQAAEENRFIIIGRPVMPRKQNLRAIVATMPRN